MRQRMLLMAFSGVAAVVAKSPRCVETMYLRISHRLSFTVVMVVVIFKIRGKRRGVSGDLVAL